MKTAIKPVLIISILLAAMLTAPLVFSGGRHAEGMEHGQIMNMEVMQGDMHDMSEMMNEAYNSKDMNKRHELMRKHMSQMQTMMGNMQNMMSDKMPGNMSMEQRQKMMSNRMDMMQGMMEQMMKQQSMMMDMQK